MRMKKWQWIGHTLRNGYESIEKQVLGCNPRGTRRRGRPKQNSKRTVLEEAGKWGQMWSEMEVNRLRWRIFTNALVS